MVSAIFRFARFRGAGNALMTGRPERMLLAAIAVGIGFGRNVLSRRALALIERIGIGHDLVFLDVLDLA
jgi:hypothetical protein